MVELSLGDRREVVQVLRSVRIQAVPGKAVAEPLDASSWRDGPKRIPLSGT